MLRFEQAVIDLLLIKEEEPVLIAKFSWLCIWKYSA